MIQLSKAGKRFGPKVLFEDVDWMITPDDRIGLVGANGTGKSTLLKILAGLESLDSGALTRAKGATAGYLPQAGLASPAAAYSPSACPCSPGCATWNRKWKISPGAWLSSIRQAWNTARWRTGSTPSRANFRLATDTPSRRRWEQCSPDSVFRRTTGAAAPRNFR